MSECDHIREASLYHDGEMTREEASRFEEHLRQCQACRRELEEIRRLSALLSSIRGPSLESDVLGRLHRTATGAEEGVVVSMARRLIAVAAAIMVACTAWTLGVGGRTEAAAAGEPWELTAVTLRTEVSDAQRVAQWMVENLPSENGNDR